MKSRSGFTLVELLIVIVVIAILAAISVVAYNGIQDRANDTRMRAGVAQIEKAIMMWHTETGQQPVGGWSSSVAIGSGTNCSNGNGGWLASGTYTCAFEDALRNTGLLPANFVRSLPGSPTSAGSGAYSVMFYACGSNRYALSYHLRRPTAEDSANMTQSESIGCQSAPRTSYHMRGVKVIQL